MIQISVCRSRDGRFDLDSDCSHTLTRGRTCARNRRSVPEASISAGYIARAGTMAAREHGSRSLFFGGVLLGRVRLPSPALPLQGASGRVRSPAQLIRPNSEVRAVPAVRPPPHPDALEPPLIARRNIRLDNAVLASRRGFPA